MAKQAENAREAIKTKLELGEQLRSVGLFYTGPFWAMILLSSLFVFAMKYYWVGVTDKRLIFVRLSAVNKPIEKDNFAVPLTDIEFKGMNILAKLPGKPKPQKFMMEFGLKGITGFDPNEFRAALKAN